MILDYYQTIISFKYFPPPSYRLLAPVPEKANAKCECSGSKAYYRNIHRPKFILNRLD